MTNAQFKPNQWVQFKVGTSQVIGQIIGARNDGEAWFYNVTNGAGSNPYFVNESDITTTIAPQE